MPFAHVNGIRLHYEIEGKGPPLLLIAGTGFPGATWRTGISDKLACEGFQVITYDHRGSGQSDKTETPYSTRMFASDAIGLLSSLDIGHAHALGHSMGGRVAQWIALDSPDRLDKLVLAASGPGQFDPNVTVTRGIPLETGIGMVEKGYETYIREHIAGAFFFTEEFAGSCKDVVDQLTNSFWVNRPTIKCYLRHVIARQQHQTAERLSEIEKSTLIIVGDQDSYKGGTGSHVRQSEYLAQEIPDARLKTVLGGAHAFFWEKPDETIRVVAEFLRG